MSEKEMLKMAFVSGAAQALKFKRKNPNATDDEAIRHVTSESNEMLRRLGSDD